jgi:hypothetical protein
MESTITSVAAMIPEGSLPIVVCVLGLAYIYWKINSQRKVTKSERDNAHEDLDKRVTLLERELEEIKSLDLSAKLAQILTDLQWLKEKLK